MRESFLDYLNDRVVVCDGAMGTQLYAKGVFLNRCFDELNLSRPALVREVHQEYLWAGAEILESNTFGANQIKLEPHGLAERMREINIAGVQLAREVAQDSAFVAGSVGPLGIRVEPYGKLSSDEAKRIFAEQISALAEAGADLISLETFSDLNEIHAAILAAREVCALPIMAQLTLEEDGNSLDGTPPEVFGLQLENWGADVVGVNCGVGPQVMLDCIEHISKVVTCKLAAQPNAGKPRNFEGRNLYLSSPEYMASYAKRFIRAGVQVVGGCCGTKPAHIKAIRDAVRALKASPHKPVTITAGPAFPAIETVPLEQRSRLAQGIRDRRFVNLVGITAPRGSDPADVIRWARIFQEEGVDAVRVSDAPRGSAGMTAMALALLVQRESGAEPILHYTCGHRGLLTMQSELLGAYALGLRNLLLSTGDPIRVGEYLDATAVFDVDSVGATRLVSGLNVGKDLGGKALGRPTGFYVGVSVDPSALNLEEESRLLASKVEAGAHFAITGPLFRPEVLERFLDRTQPGRIPLIAGLRLLTSYQDAEFLNNEVPGISLPESHIARMRAAGTPERERAEGIAIARELAQELRGMAQGIEITVPGGNYSLALEVLDL